MRKLIYIFCAVVLFSCGPEADKGKGEIVNDIEEGKEDKNGSVKKDSSTEILKEEVKDILDLPGGTRISFLKHGTGEKLKKGEMVSVIYKTFLPDGKLIDGSDIIGHPLPYFIGINMSVQGWDEAFLEFRVGDKVKLHLPSAKAYGKKGFGTMVPPDTDLDFDIEITEKINPVTTASGLKYFYLVKNEKGKATKEGGKIDIHYYGWTFKDGKLFDSSHYNGKMYRFTVGAGEEIACWEEIVKLMRQGEKILMISPSNLAYAEKGVPELVPPNSKLVFIIELMDVL